MIPSPALDAAALLALPPRTRVRPELQPLLYAVLAASGRLGELPPLQCAAARRAYYTTLARNTVIRQTLLEVIDQAAAVGAKLLPLKGALLAFAAYPDPGMRPMSDIDLAVHPEEVDPLVAQLQRSGFVRYGTGPRFALDQTHHIILQRPSTPMVELHVRLLHELAVDGEVRSLFDRAIALELCERKVQALCWSDHFFFVALHAAAHGFSYSPLWLIDLALLWPRVGDFSVVARQAQTRRAVAALHFACALAQRYFPSLRSAMPLPRWSGARTWLLRHTLGEDPLARSVSQRDSLLTRAALIDRLPEIVPWLGDKILLRLRERKLV